MDLNKLREQLEKSRPVRVTRSGRLRPDDDSRPAQESEPARRPSRLKTHTFALDDARWAQERALMSLHTQARQIEFEGQRAFEERTETVFGVDFHFVFVVPDHFPAVAPDVYCLEPVVPRQTKYHVYSNGTLCLFLPGEWHSGLTLLDVRNWTCEWAFNVVPRLMAGDDWISPEH